MVDLGSAVGYLLLDTSGFTKGFETAGQQLKTFQSGTTTAMDKIASTGKTLSTVGGSLTKTVTLPIVGIGTAAVKTAGDFESAMSQVQATLGISADATSELNGEVVNTKDALSDLAKELGASTKFSATEAAEAINNMAMAGYRTQEIYDTLPQVLSLASAGALDLDYATELVANGLNVMGLETSDAAEFADKLAVTASNAYGSVSDFGEGILIAGAQASLANVSLTDTYTALGILGDNGISASEGGTYLRNTLKNLYTPTDDAAKALEDLGVKTAEDDGTLRDFQVVLQDLNSAMEPLTEDERIKAMSRIFDTRTISAANALMQNSSERWDELSSAIDNSAGAAERMADTQLDNLQGQLTILKSSLEGAAIAFGELLLPMIKDVTDGIQKMVDWVNGLDERQKNIIVTIAEVAAVVGPLLLIGGKVMTLISSIGPILTALTGPIGIVVLAVAALAAAWATDFGGIREKTETIFNSIKNIITSIVENIKRIWDEDLNGIRTIATEVWETIETVFGDALDVLVNLFQVFEDIFNGDWESLWEDVKTLFSSVWQTIKDLLSGALQAVIDIIINVGLDLIEAARTAFENIKTGFQEKWAEIKEWFQEAKNDPIGAITGIFTSMYTAGKDLFTNLWDGIKSVWEDIKSWVTEKVDWLKERVQFWKDKRGEIDADYSGSTSISGSFATGLDYVPRDMNVRVHEGETILTKQMTSELVNAFSTLLTGMGSGDLIVPVEVNGERLATAVLPDFRRIAAASGNPLGAM